MIITAVDDIYFITVRQQKCVETISFNALFLSGEKVVTLGLLWPQNNPKTAKWLRPGDWNFQPPGYFLWINFAQLAGKYRCGVATLPRFHQHQHAVVRHDNLLLSGRNRRVFVLVQSFFDLLLDIQQGGFQRGCLGSGFWEVGNMGSAAVRG